MTVGEQEQELCSCHTNKTTKWYQHRPLDSGFVVVRFIFGERIILASGLTDCLLNETGYRYFENLQPAEKNHQKRRGIFSYNSKADVDQPGTTTSLLKQNKNLLLYDVVQPIPCRKHVLTPIGTVILTSMRLSDFVLKLLALPARTIGKVFDQ